MTTKASRSGDSETTTATGTSTTTEADNVDQSSVTINTGDSFTRNVDIDWSPWTHHFPWDADEAEAK